MWTEAIRYEQEPTPEVLLDCLTKDKVRRHASFRQVYEIIASTNDSYTLFIDGAWGSGKTFLVKQLIELFRHKNTFLKSDLDEEQLKAFCDTAQIKTFHSQFIPIYFNAWEADHYEDPLCPLLCEMAIQLDEHVSTKDRDYKGAIISIINSLLPVDVSEAIEKLSGGEGFLEEYKKRLALREKFNKLIEDTLNSDNERLVLFIDELDRCRPEFAIRLLEQTKQLFNNPRMTVVISTDAVQLGHVLRGVYGEGFDAKKYLEKFYDRRIELSKVKPLEYLKLLGYEDHGYRGFESVIRTLLERNELTMRDLQKLAPMLIEARQFASNYLNKNSNGTALASNVLLPCFVVIAYSEPELWRSIKEASRYERVYEYVKDIPALDELYKWLFPQQENTVENLAEDNSEQECEQFVYDLCTLLFNDNDQESSFIEAQDRVGGFNSPRVFRKQIVDFNFD